MDFYFSQLQFQSGRRVELLRTCFLNYFSTYQAGYPNPSPSPNPNPNMPKEIKDLFRVSGVNLIVCNSLFPLQAKESC